MISTRYYLDCRRGSEVGTLKIVICKDRVRALIPTNIKLHPDNWDPKNQKATGDYESYNPLLKERMGVVEAYIFKSDTWNDFSGLRACQIKDKVMAHLFGEEKEEVKLPANNFKKRYAEFMASRPAAGTRDLYDRTWTQIKKFAKKEKFNLNTLTFEDINLKWLRDFDAFLLPTSPSRNARNIHFRNIRAVFNDALDDEVISCYPFRKFKIKGEETRKRSLSVENLRKIFNCKVEKYAEFYRDMFKLSFFLIGINPVDLANLDSITPEGRVEYERAKTHRDYSIKIEPEALEIINKYRGKKKLLLIMDRWQNYKNFARQMNIALQCIGAKRTGLGGTKGDGMFKDITCYWARHTWATIARKIGISRDDIKLSLGHGKKTTTDIYIDEDAEKIDVANRRVIDWVLYGKS